MQQAIIAAFITGLTAGGLSCLAVQGGLVTSSLANQIEVDLREKAGKPTGKPARKQSAPKRGMALAQPILVFLGSKLAVHTLLGFLLGALGSVLSLTPVMRGILQIAIAVFMIGNALRMLNVHPIFRFFSFEPPARITRYIRRRSKSQDAMITPVLMGLLTVLIPCGITQSMMALAIGTGSPLTGAAILFAYVLGTTPVFFGVTYLATGLGSLFEKNFSRFVAVILLVLGAVTFNTGLNLVGSPVSFNQPTAQSQPETGPLQTYNPAGLSVQGPSDRSAAEEPAAPGELTLNVLNSGYSPRMVTAPADLPIKLKLVSNGVYSCSRAFVIPALNYEALLDASGTKTVDIPPQKAGTVMRFSCSMGMYTGAIVFQ